MAAIAIESAVTLPSAIDAAIDHAAADVRAGRADDIELRTCIGIASPSVA